MQLYEGSWRVQLRGALVAVMGCVALADGLQAQTVDTVNWSEPHKARQVLEARLTSTLMAQREAWQQMELREHGEMPRMINDPGSSQRFAMFHCHPDRKLIAEPGRPVEKYSLDGQRYVVHEPASPYPLPTLIQSTVRVVALCPNWIPSVAQYRRAPRTHEYAGPPRL